MSNEQKKNEDCTACRTKLRQTLRLSLEHYSNVHRGSGQNSLTATHLFEKARQVVLEHFGFSCKRYAAIFCTPYRAKTLISQLKPGSFRSVASRELGLPISVVAVAVQKDALPRQAPFQTGGGTVKIVSEDHVLWADAPDKFEAGTPAIVNVILFARALSLTRKRGITSLPPVHPGKTSLASLFSTPEFDLLHGLKLLRKMKSSLVGRELRVPTEKGDLPYTNLDNGASTPTFEPVHQVAEKVLEAPPSLNSQIVQVGSRTVLSFLGAPASKFELIFTSNTTEAINIAAINLARSTKDNIEPVIVNSLLEHNSNELPWRTIPGSSLVRLGVDCEGFIDLNALEATLIEYNQQKAHGRKRIVLVAVSGASNVLGSFNDLDAIARLAHHHGAAVLVDAAQLIAHRTVYMEKSGIDYLAFSGHKAYAPFGTGGLIVRKDLVKLPRLQLEQLAASGEENTLGIATLTKMMQIFDHIGMDVVERDEHELAAQLLQGLTSIPELEIYGVCSNSSPRIKQKSAVVAISAKTIPFNLFANRLAERGGIGVRSGCFCAHLLGKHLLGITGGWARLADLGFRILPRFTKNLIPGLVRVSAGLENTPADIEHLLVILREVLAEERSGLEKRLAAARCGTPFIRKPPIELKINEHAASVLSEVFSV